VKDYLSEAVICHLIKYGLIALIAFMTYDILDERLPEKLIPKKMEVMGNNIVFENDHPLPANRSLKKIEPELADTVINILERPNQKLAKNIALFLYNTGGERISAKAFTGSQICSAILMIEQNLAQLQKCILKDYQRIQVALGSLIDRYLLDKFHWGNDPKKLNRFRLSRLGHDSVSTYQKQMVSKGNFKIDELLRYDFEKNGQLKKLDQFEELKVD